MITFHTDTGNVSFSRSEVDFMARQTRDPIAREVFLAAQAADDRARRRASVRVTRDGCSVREIDQRLPSCLRRLKIGDINRLERLAYEVDYKPDLKARALHAYWLALKGGCDCPRCTGTAAPTRDAAMQDGGVIVNAYFHS